MDVFTFTLTLLVSFLGLLVGGFLAHNSEDEVHKFKKFLPFIQLLLFVLVFVVFFVSLPFFVALMILILSFAFIYLFWHKKNINTLDYIVFAVLFALSSLNFVYHLYMTLILFAFGIFSGALYYVLHTKPNHKTPNVSYHKHSGKHLEIGELLYSLFNHYYFFLIVSFLAYLVSQIGVSIFG